jgi:hypothetical protein
MGIKTSSFKVFLQFTRMRKLFVIFWTFLRKWCGKTLVEHSSWLDVKVSVCDFSYFTHIEGIILQCFYWVFLAIFFCLPVMNYFAHFHTVKTTVIWIENLDPRTLPHFSSDLENCKKLYQNNWGGARPPPFPSLATPGFRLYFKGVLYYTSYEKHSEE